LLATLILYVLQYADDRLWLQAIGACKRTKLVRLKQTQQRTDLFATIARTKETKVAVNQMLGQEFNGMLYDNIDHEMHNRCIASDENLPLRSHKIEITKQRAWRVQCMI